MIAESRHTRLPVGAVDGENFVGVVHIRDLLARLLSGQELDLNAVVTPVPAVYVAIPVLRTLEILRQSGSRMALVVDEYGGLEGIITLTDVLEAIVGDLPEAGRREQPGVVEGPNGSLVVDGLVAIEDIKLKLGLQALPGEDEVTTVGGFVLTALGRLPKPGDTVHYGGYIFTVLSMTGRRIDKLHIDGGPEPLAEDEGG